MSRTLHPETIRIRGRARGTSPFRRCGVDWPGTPAGRDVEWHEVRADQFTPEQLQFLLDSRELVIEQDGELQAAMRPRMTQTIEPTPPELQPRELAAGEVLEQGTLPAGAAVTVEPLDPADHPSEHPDEPTPPAPPEPPEEEPAVPEPAPLAATKPEKPGRKR